MTTRKSPPPIALVRKLRLICLFAGAFTSASACNARHDSEENLDLDVGSSDISDSADDESESHSSEESSESTTNSSGDSTAQDAECPTIRATIRDFSKSHPDFEKFSGSTATTGLVQSQLDADRKPIYANAGATSQTSSKDNFDQWYRDVPGTNQTFEISLVMMSVGPNACSFHESTFFPIDGKGFGSEGLKGSDGNEHNFLFTTEIHTSFVYRPGQVFTFVGDDDLWMFIDGTLRIDLGGLHPALESSVSLDSLGLTDGETYAMDIFHAERHTTESNFRVDTNIDFLPPE
jgi:fibro-slime domain-containing protein